jgi:hypothetical protein
MPSSKSRKIVAGTGMLLFSACLAAVLIHFNGWIQSHSQAVTWIMYGTGIACLGCFGFWLLTSDSAVKTDAPSPSAEGQSTRTEAKADFRPNNEVNPTIQVSPVFQVSASHPARIVDVAPSAERQTESKPRPNLLICGARKVKIADQAQKFELNGSGSLGLLVKVENPESRDPDERVMKARNIVAVVRFSGHDISATASRAYWRGFWENQISIDVGENQDVVVGTFHDSVWSYYINNRRERPYPQRPTMQALRNMAERPNLPIQPESLPTEPFLDAEVSIISVDTGYSVARASFRIIPEDEGRDFSFGQLDLSIKSTT